MTNPTIGATVQVLINGRPEMVEVTNVYPDLDPPRFDGNRVVHKDDDWKYPEEGDKSVWGYMSDILVVVNP